MLITHAVELSGHDLCFRMCPFVDVCALVDNWTHEYSLGRDEDNLPSHRGAECWDNRIVDTFPSVLRCPKVARPTPLLYALSNDSIAAKTKHVLLIQYGVLFWNEQKWAKWSRDVFSSSNSAHNQLCRLMSGSTNDVPPCNKKKKCAKRCEYFRNITKLSNRRIIRDAPGYWMFRPKRNPPSISHWYWLL